MQFLACGKLNPLKFIGFQSQDREMLCRLDAAIEGLLSGEDEVNNTGIE